MRIENHLNSLVGRNKFYYITKYHGASIAYYTILVEMGIALDH